MGIGQPRNLQNLRFADDVLLVGKSLPQVHRMLVGLSEEAARVIAGGVMDYRYELMKLKCQWRRRKYRRSEM